MKRFFLILAISVVFVSVISAQTVDSIKVEQAGEFIKVRYKILNSTPDQMYRVKVLCSINGGMNTEIRSISGDVGDMVAGGKPEYFVVWDVLKDVDELKSAEFIIRAELVKDLSALAGKEIDWANKKFHILFESDFPGPKFGLMIGAMGKWGFAGTFLYGKLGFHGNPEGTLPVRNIPYVGLSLSKRIANKNNVQAHLMAGPSYFKAVVYDKSGGMYIMKKAFGLNLGLLLDINRFSISVGTAQFPVIVKKEQLDGFLDYSSHSYFNVGIGLRL